MELVREVDLWLSKFRAVFRRQATFGWFALSVWALLLRSDGSGLTSVIRYFGLAASEDTHITRLHQWVTSTTRVVGTVLADCQYACRSFMEGLLCAGFHLIARVRLNTVAFKPAPPPRQRKRGWPKKYAHAWKRLAVHGRKHARPP
jgi:hypothetical protein